MHSIGTPAWEEHLAKAVLTACDPAFMVLTAMSESTCTLPAGVLAIGKSAADMALGALEALRTLRAPETPLCVMAPQERLGLLPVHPAIECYIGDHPESSLRNQQSAAKVLDWLRRTGAHGDVVVLLSGGASAYLTSPMNGIRNEDLNAVYATIRQGGGTIEDLNCVRKHCEAMKGGRLAGLAKRTLVLVLSDVISNRLDVISSGPFVADSSTCQDAISVLERFNLAERYPKILEHLSRIENETPKSDDAKFAHVEHRILASHVHAVRATADLIGQQGIAVRHQVSHAIGEPEDIAAGVQDKIHSLRIGEGLVIGGEPTVDAREAVAGARGGPSQELCLALALNMQKCGGHGTAWALSTDGVDGNSPYAGGWLSSDMLESAHIRGFAAREFRECHDASSFLEEAAGEIFTGPTGVNLNHVACVVRTG